MKQAALCMLIAVILLAGCGCGAKQERAPDAPEQRPAPHVFVIEHPVDPYMAPVDPREVEPDREHLTVAGNLGFSVEIADPAEAEAMIRVVPADRGRNIHVQSHSGSLFLHLTLELPARDETVSVTLLPGLVLPDGILPDEVTYSFRRTDPVRCGYTVAAEEGFQVTPDIYFEHGNPGRGEYWYLPHPPVTLEFSFEGELDPGAVEARLGEQLDGLDEPTWLTPQRLSLDWHPDPGLHVVSWGSLRDERGVFLESRALLLEVGTPVSVSGWVPGGDSIPLHRVTLPREPAPSGWANAREDLILLRAGPIAAHNSGSNTLWSLCTREGAIRFLGGPWTFLTAEWLPVSGNIAVGAGSRAFLLDSSGTPIRDLLNLEDGLILDVAVRADDHLAVFAARLLEDPDREPYPFRRVLDAWIFDPEGQLVYHWPEIAPHGASHPELPGGVSPVWVGDQIYLALCEPDDEMGTHAPSLVILEIPSGDLRATGLSFDSIHRVGETLYAYRNLDDSAWHLLNPATGQDRRLPDPKELDHAAPVAREADLVLYVIDRRGGALVYDLARQEVVSRIREYGILLSGCAERWIWTSDPG